MATFESIRYCQQAEFEYFKEERRELVALQAGELCVAMFKLKTSVGNCNAIAIPLLIVEPNENTVIWQGFTNKNQLSAKKFKFVYKPDNYIKSDNVIILPEKVPLDDTGYIRDQHEGLDGTPLEISFSDEITSLQTTHRTEPIYA